MKVLLRSFVIIILLVLRIKECKRKELVIQPKQLKKLIQEEINKKAFDVRRTHAKQYEMTTTISLTQYNADEPPLEQEFDDEDALKSRKIWSRWSKWSDCSVSCGRGAIVRQRMCVSGRCAPRELEEQRRQCYRPPCNQHTNSFEDTETK